MNAPDPDTQQERVEEAVGARLGLQAAQVELLRQIRDAIVGGETELANDLMANAKRLNELIIELALVDIEISEADNPAPSRD